jgi:heme-degrading monooxygenase HmoA
MSVLVTMKVKGDTDQFKRVLEADTQRIQGLAARARDKGCIHHRFAAGDGFVMVVDEWETAEAFQSFISSPEIAEVMGDMGAQGPPEVEIAEAIESPDQF